MLGFLTKLIGTKNEREIKKLWSDIEQVNALESAISSLDDAGLKAKTDEFRRRLEGEGTGDLDEILPEAFAVV
ncbi:MAG: preprotein translocase SecA, partial [Thermodesulfovibrionia bacterium]|nr:preprotein translocase SecA [Thermodesulfovibrionia bacterium]